MAVTAVVHRQILQVLHRALTARAVAVVGSTTRGTVAYRIAATALPTTAATISAFASFAHSSQFRVFHVSDISEPETQKR